MAIIEENISTPLFDSFTNITVVFPRYNDSTTLRCASSMTLQEVFSRLKVPQDLKHAEHIYDSTLNTKRDLGPLEQCLNQTLSHLQLWPSATIHITFPGDNEEGWTLTVKSVKNPKDQVKLNLIRSMDTVSLLKKKVASKSEVMTPSAALKLIYGGKILNDEDPLIRCGISSGDTILCLKIETQASPSSIVVPNVATPSSNVSMTPSNQETEPSSSSSPSSSSVNSGETHVAQEDNSILMCRICYGTGDESCPLITPCRCRGSIGLVHLECLNSWRRLAPTEASYRRCDQCGYEYRFERTRIAEFLLSATGVWSIAIILCMVLLYVGSYLVHFSPLLLQQFVDKYSWVPQIPKVFMMGNRRLPLFYWFPQLWVKVNNHLLFLKGGAFFFGVVGFLQYVLDEAMHLYIRRQMFGGHVLNMHTAMGLVSFCSLLSGQMSRVVVVVGFAGCAHVVALSAHAKSKELAQWLGERMLSVE